MLLTPLKCAGSSASTFLGARDGFVVRNERLQRSVQPLQVRAAAPSDQPGTGWLASTVGSLTGKTRNGQASKFVQSADMVTYSGKAVIMKKLKVLDLMDRVADAQDDASEVLAGKHVSVQLVSNEVDPSMTSAKHQEIVPAPLLLLFSHSLLDCSDFFEVD